MTEPAQRLDRNLVEAGGVHVPYDCDSARRGGATDDSELVKRARDGNLEAYDEIVVRHAPLALRTAVFLGADDEADDVVQLAFVKAFHALSRFRDGPRSGRGCSGSSRTRPTM